MRPLLPSPAVRTTAWLGLGAAALLATAGWAATRHDKLERLNVAETELNAEQAHNMSELARLLSAVEQLSRDPPPALLVSTGDALDAVRAQILVKALAPEMQRRAKVYAYETGQMVRQRRLAAVESEALFTSDSALADQAPAPAQGGLPPRLPEPSGPRRAPDSLVAPVSGQLLRGFGERAPGGGKSLGLTWQAPDASRVGSPAAGLVQYEGPVKGWGTILIIRLTGGYHVVLAGLDRASVRVGQSVAPGQPVGWMPDGRQSTSELYLEIRNQGAPIDPARWLANRG